MTPSEIAGRLMILGTKLESKQCTDEAQTCAEAAAWILFWLDKTQDMGAEAFDRSVTSSPIATVKPLFSSIMKRDL